MYNQFRFPARLRTIVLGFAVLAVYGCASTPVADHCVGTLNTNLSQAVGQVESRLSTGCEYHFDRYFQELVDIARAAPDPENKNTFSDFLVRVSDDGLITKRQAKEKYNRYFSVKYMSFTGDYNTCAQACPIQAQVMSEMQGELLDKQRGLLEAAQDKQGYYRADHLLKETQLVLEATCRACQGTL